MKIRALWLTLHRWIGLVGLIAMFILGLTGSALVWPDSTEALFYPGRFTEKPVEQSRSIEDIVAAASAALPEGDRISAMRLPYQSNQGVLVGGGAVKVDRVGPPARNRVWVNPETAEVTAEAALSPDFMWYMHALHGHFGVKEPGRFFVGISGFVLCFSVFTGIWLWWPKNGKILKALRWRRSPSTLSNLHHMIGIWSAVPMMVLAFTGAYIVFPGMFGTIVSIATGERGVQTGGRVEGAEPPMVNSASTTQLSAQMVADLATNNGTDALLFMSWPTETSPMWRVEVACAEPSAAECAGAMIINDTTGEVIAQKSGLEESNAQKMAELMDRVHAGHIGGPIWAIIVFIMGFILSLLSLTGIYMWWKMRPGRKRVAALRKQAASGVA